MGNSCLKSGTSGVHHGGQERETNSKMEMKDNESPLRDIVMCTLDVQLKDCIAYKPDIKYGKVVKVYDGDTITIATRLKGDDTIYKFSVRLARVDAPELRTRNEIEKKAGYVVRDHLDNFICGKMVCLKNVGYDKYGRILAEVYLLKSPAIEIKRMYMNGESPFVEEINVSDWLLSNRYVVPYDGGTKANIDWSYLI
jgi:endonuclease YncB( thermonuclease family)